MESDWVSEAETLDSSTTLLLDTFHALWNLYGPSSERSCTAARDEGGEETPRAEYTGGAEKVPDRLEASSSWLRAAGGARGGPRRSMILLAVPARLLR